MARRFHVDLTGFTKREVAEIWQVSFGTVSNMISRRELRGEMVYRGGVAEWRFTADQIAAADAIRQARRDRWKPRQLANLNKGRRTSAAVRRMKAAARDDLPEIRRLADLVAGHLGTDRVRALLEGALR